MAVVSFHVISVIDANTIKIQSGTQARHIRLIGIEPLQADPEAAALMVRRYLAGREVFVEIEPAVGPAWAYVYRKPDGLFINRQIIIDGYALVPDAARFRHRKNFLEAQTAARTARRGLWKGRTFVSDWETRFSGVRYLGETYSVGRPQSQSQRPAKPKARPKR